MKRKFIWLGLVLLLSIPSVSSAQLPQFNTTQYRGSFAVETLTVSSVAKILTNATYAPTTCAIAAQCRADYALITTEGDSLRYWPNGTAPTSSVGHLVPASGSFFVWGYDNIANLKMIRVTTDVTIQVSYYRFSTNTP